MRRKIIRSAFSRYTAVARRRRPHLSNKRRRQLNNFGVQRSRYLFTVPVLLAAIVIAAAIKLPLGNTVRYRPLERALVNPLMGWAVDAASDPAQAGGQYTLAFARLSWREFEPEEGQYDFESFESRNHFEQWRALGVRIILRFVMDVPGGQAHADIPDWLIEQMGDQAGTYYTSDLGVGFSPDYNNLLLQDRHFKAIEKLGERYNADELIAYVELGSLGHDGTWWVDREAGVDALPLQSETRNFVSAYTYAFSDTQLMARSPYQSAKLISAGLYNPRLGDTQATWNWLDMAVYGGYEEQIGANLRGMGRFYENVPSGAAISGEVDVQALVNQDLQRLIDQLRESHTTYVTGAPQGELSEQTRRGMALALESMGYRLWIRSAQWVGSARAGSSLRVNLLWRNSGVAPMSRAWPVALSLYKDGVEAARSITEIDVTGIAPGEQRADGTLEIPFGLSAGVYQLGLSILDPATGEAGVQLAMQTQNAGLTSLLGTVEVYR